MEVKYIILIIIAFLNLLLGGFIFFRSQKSPINVSFSIFLGGAFLWTLGLVFFMTSLNVEIAAYWSRVYYFAAAIIVLAFLMFANYYLYSYHKLTEVRISYFFIPFVIITFVIFHPTLLIGEVTHYDWGNDANENLLGHLMFAFYFFTYLIISYYILFKKLKRSDGMHRVSLKIIIWSTLVSYVFGIIFDLILPIAGEYRFVWVGPVFTVVTIFFLSYYLFIKSR